MAWKIVRGEIEGERDDGGRELMSGMLGRCRYVEGRYGSHMWCEICRLVLSVYRKSQDGAW